MFGEAQMGGVPPSHVDMRVRANPSVKELPQFPTFLKSVNLLHRRINAASVDELKKKQERLRGVEEQRKIIEAATQVVLPPPAESVVDVDERYDPQPRWRNFVLHDVRSLITTTTGMSRIVSSVLAEKDPQFEMFATLGKAAADTNTNDDLSLMKKIQTVDHCITYFDHNIDKAVSVAEEDFKPYKGTIESVKNVAKVWDMLYRSSLMLNGVRNEDYDQVDRWFKALSKTQVTLKDIFPVAAKHMTVEYPPEIGDKKIDGVRGIMLFNLVKNAAVHKKSYIKVGMKDGEITVENDAEGLPEESDMFTRLRPGKKGNTGFGLFTIKNIYGTLGGHDVTYEGKKGSADSPDTVTFTIKPAVPEKSQPASTVSPLPQPAR
ncbi:MAG: ATP-binding protein [Microgenomates group bacterium]